MIKRIPALLIALYCSCTLFAQAPRSYTSSEILLQLKKLNTVGSVLYIAAHPDDENTRLLTYLANEKCLRTAYLSLTRGDGGQNLIGPEQGVELGVIRTQELLAARRIDGAEQFFTRAYDFGFSKNPEETFKKWNRDSVLADMVWVIRLFRPDMIITRFATDGSGGHGHHTASAILAEEAFDAAADPNRFPEQLRYVQVWQTRRMFYNTTARFRDPNADMSAYIKLDVGGYNPLLGKSYGEIAAESRSMHKSQGFGSARQRGEFLEHFKPIKGDTTGLKDIFEGIDFTWKRIKGGEPVGNEIAKTIQAYNIQQPQLSMPALIRIHQVLNNDVNGIVNEVSLLLHKRSLLNEVMLAAAGVNAETIANKSEISLSDTFQCDFNAINRSDAKADLYIYKPVSPAIIFSDNTFQPQQHRTLNNNTLLSNKQGMFVMPTMKSQPSWWEQRIVNNMFVPLPYVMRLDKDNKASEQVNMQFLFDQTPVNIIRPLMYKWVDPEKGELYRSLLITPPVMINTMNQSVTFVNDLPREIKVVVKAGKDSISGVLSIEIPQGWKIEINTAGKLLSPIFAGTSFELAKKGQEKVFTFIVTPPKGAAETVIRPVVTMRGKTYSKGFKEIRYDHIPVQTLFPEAETKLVRLDVKRNLKRIGYIPGAGDEVAPSLTQLGYDVTIITDEMLAKEDLSRYDAIVTGVRAYNTNDKLPIYKQKLMDFVNAGGNLVVQYNTNSWAGPLNSDIGPYKFKITRDRVTDEEAKVNFDLPKHPVLNYPNRITEADFNGWIQERCIYSAGDFAPQYETPISMADPNEAANKGSLIIAKHGKGHFVYTGLVFFRELPAGVPGAYRLFVNMIELGKQ